MLASFTRLCAFLVGFFGIGVTLSIGWILGGYELLIKLLSGALIHGPLELVAVLLCVAEPLRLAEDRKDVDLRIILREDFKLLSACLLVLVLAAGLEVFIGL